MDGKGTIVDDKKPEPTEVTPTAVIHLEAALGSSLFAINIENCDAIQLLGCAEMLHAQGLMALAGEMAKASQDQKPKSPIVVAPGPLRDHLPKRN